MTKKQIIMTILTLSIGLGVLPAQLEAFWGFPPRSNIQATGIEQAAYVGCGLSIAAGLTYGAYRIIQPRLNDTQRGWLWSAAFTAVAVPCFPFFALYNILSGQLPPAANGPAQSWVPWQERCLRCNNRVRSAAGPFSGGSSMPLHRWCRDAYLSRQV